MFLEYYKLKEQPFGVTPDPGFLFLSPTHREALASLSYGVTAGRGFTVLIAPPGTGKTTLLFKLLKQLETSARTVFIFQTQCSPRDFLRSVLIDLGFECDGDLVRIQSELTRVLLREARSGRRFVLVIDEAQNLEPLGLELLRMLSNFETPRHKLMHLVLAGQPQLAQTLNSPHLVQLRQRVSIIARLKAFTEEETRLYIDHRLRVAGYDCPHTMFTENALAMIASFSEGIPRNINNICFNALSLGRALRRKNIDSDVVGEVLDDLDLGSLRDAATYTPPARLTRAPLSRPASVAHGVREGAPIKWKKTFALVAILLLMVAWPVNLRQPRGKAITRQMAVTTQVSSAVTGSPVFRVATAFAGPQHPESTNAAEVTPSASSVPTLQAVAPRPSVAERGTQNLIRTVHVAPNQTLYEISIENLGRYDDTTLRKIRALNPWLNNPDYVQSGSKILLPFLDEGSR
jgi:type II secretory pathway predicted ATPase ExeA